MSSVCRVVMARGCSVWDVVASLSSLRQMVYLLIG